MLTEQRETVEPIQQAQQSAAPVALDIAYRVVPAQIFLDHTSIAWFRKEHGAALEDLFPKILLLCKNAGLVKLGRVALVGSKIKANAALDKNRTLSHLREEVKG
ncbi:hypothetical protein ACSYAY_08680 [Leptospirillum ferriphilum]|uniref:Mobile element protein n=2 Tax=Leptospirillum TaxID=179 RepID=A0A094X4Y4_9BACT|nr:hypothetical protein [Leptospirillum ferriphilum]EDZ38850.1 MAG: Conserved hypothetical protein [Leptospirillum sp. Group II '5-way CG']KGA93614.1 Mobile element protein [Leptospirillum ferriphilum]